MTGRNQSLDPPAESFRAPYYVRGLSMGLCAYLIGVHLWTWVFTGPVMIGGHADFRLFYTIGYMVRTGKGALLYDYDSQTRFQNQVVGPAGFTFPCDHLAYEAILFSPLSRLSYRGAYFTFLALNLALLALCFVLMRSRLQNLGQIFAWLPVALFLGFLPIAAALIQGQDSILLLTLLLVAFICLDSGKPAIAGALCGIGIFKFQLVLPIAVLFLAWKSWRFVMGFATSSALMTFISVWLVGRDAARDYLATLVKMSAQAAQVRYTLQPNVMPNIRGLIYGMVGAGHLAFALTIALSIAALWFTANYAGEDKFQLSIVASALVSYHLLIHDMSILALPVFTALNQNVSFEGSRSSIRRSIFRAAAAMFVAPLLISYAPDHFYLTSIPLLVFAAYLASR